MASTKSAMPEVQTQYFALSGGLDQTSPALQLLPGVCRDALNFECNLQGGYTRIFGFERFDGRPSPSDQAYWTLTATVTGTIAVGDTITGATSGATGVVAYIDSATMPGTTYIVFTKLVGSFDADGELLNDAGTAVATINGAEVRNGAPTPKTDVMYAKLASDIYRADIQAVPGSGGVLGTWMYNDVTYAFRNTADGSAAAMWKATVDGWTQVTTPTLKAGGRYEFVDGNFGGSAAMLKMFGVDGVNPGFMFDGTTFTQISTGMAIDTPNHVEFHRNYLWYAYDASLQHSAIGDPTTWSVVVGAGELAVGETINSLKSYIGNNEYIGDEASNALLVHTTSKTLVLYGASNADFSLATQSNTMGAVEATVQIADQPYYLSDLGIVNMSVTQAYGNFIMSSLSQAINPFVFQEKSRASSSCIVRAKSQYRLFFSDGYALYISFLNGKVLGMMIQDLTIPIRCVASLKKSDNTEVIFGGSDNGYVYQLEKGPNFDGQPILAYLNLAFAAFKSPRVLKRWRKASIEAKGTSYLEYSVSYDLAWATTDISPTAPYTTTAALSNTAAWDNFTWDAFFWDGVNNAPNEIPLDGTGENISLKVMSQSDMFMPFTVASAIIHYTMRRQLR